MVCKKSLYCWKNGPCASDETRKKIWEDNIRFRVSLRELNQTDHYWSFQVSTNVCLCLEGEEGCSSRNHRSSSLSLQKVKESDCASITHDCNGLKFRSCLLHCPSRAVPPESRPEAPGDAAAAGGKGTEGNGNPAADPRESELGKRAKCGRHKNVSGVADFNSAVSKKKSFFKKSFHASLENMGVFQPRKCDSEFDSDKTRDFKKKESENKTPIKNSKAPAEKFKTKSHLNDSQTSKEASNPKNKCSFINHPRRISCNPYNGDKNNNTSNDDDSKRGKSGTGNTSPSLKSSGAPNVARPNFQQKTCHRRIKKKQINHSSLWSLENRKKADGSPAEKTFPAGRNRKTGASSKTHGTASFTKNPSKPLIKFYEGS